MISLSSRLTFRLDAPAPSKEALLSTRMKPSECSTRYVEPEPLNPVPCRLPHSKSVACMASESGELLTPEFCRLS